MATLQGLLQLWRERAPRERRILLAGAAFLAIATTYAALIAPAASGVARLQRLLPQVRDQAAQLEALVVEARELRAKPPAANPGAGDARTALDKSLESAALPVARRSAAANGDVRLNFTNVPYARWTAWLAASEQAFGVRAVSVRAKPGETAGNADIELTLRVPRS
jgi:general secretion pathway protein M